MIHKGLCRFWKPLVLLLDSLGFTPLLLQCIVKELGRFRLVGAKPAQYLMGWALQIIMAGSKYCFEKGGTRFICERGDQIYWCLFTLFVTQPFIPGMGEVIGKGGI